MLGSLNLDGTDISHMVETSSFSEDSVVDPRKGTYADKFPLLRNMQSKPLDYQPVMFLAPHCLCTQGVGRQ